MTQFGVEEPIALTLLTQVPGRHPNIGLAQSHPGSRGSTSACTLAIRPTASESSPARVPHVALGALSSCPVQPLGPEPDHADHHALKARGLTHTQTHPHPRIADDRAQDRPAPLIPPTSAWTRRRKTSRGFDTTQSPTPIAPSTTTTSMPPAAPASLAPTQWEALTTTDLAAVDPAGRPINHHVAITMPGCSTTQIRPGAGGANPSPLPIGDVDTRHSGAGKSDPSPSAPKVHPARRCTALPPRFRRSVVS